MEDSIRFADQSKALWLQQNGNQNIQTQSLNLNGSNDLLEKKHFKISNSSNSCMDRLNTVLKFYNDINFI